MTMIYLVSDLIALSVVMAVGACSGPHIPLRGGRIDATGGGEFGVPEPESSIEDTLSRLQLAGFNQSDSIVLTACGHTMGSVHNGGFPQVVPPSAITPNNTGGGVHFDATPAAFDVNVVNEYLNWTGQQGGPLVTTDNVTVRSDLRLYTSDNNVTMQTHACTRVLERMINTVPAVVNLSEVISPLPVKPVNVTLEVMWNGTMSISGSIRVLISDNTTQTSTITIFVAPRDTSQAGMSIVEATYSAPEDIGSSIFGTSYFYRFGTSFESFAGTSGFSTSTNSVIGQYYVDDTVFWIPSLSHVGTEVDSNGEVAVNITAAVLGSLVVDTVNVVFSVPTPQSGTLSPRMETLSIFLDLIGTAGAYSVYSGLAQLDVNVVNRTTFDVAAKGDTDGQQRTVADKFRKLAYIL